LVAWAGVGVQQKVGGRCCHGRSKGGVRETGDRGSTVLPVRQIYPTLRSLIAKTSKQRSDEVFMGWVFAYRDDCWAGRQAVDGSVGSQRMRNQSTG
jgi:hypothetical protein